MSTEIDTVIQRFETDAAQAIAGLQEYAKAQTTAQRAAEGAAVAHVEEGRARDQAKKGVEGLGQSIRKWAREDAGEARAARYVVNEFLSFVPATGAARAGLLSFGAALVGGFGIGAALQGVSFGVQLLTKYLEEDEKKQKAAAKATEEHAKSLRELTADTDAYLRSLQNAPGSMQWMYGELHKLDEEAEPVKRRIAELRAEIEQLRTSGWKNLRGETGTDQRAELAELEQKLARIEERAARVRSGFAQRVGGEEGAEAERARREAERKAEQEAERAAERAVERERTKAEKIEQIRIDAANAQFELEQRRDQEAEQRQNEAADIIFTQEYEAQQKGLATLEEHRAQQARESLYAQEGEIADELAQVDAKYARLLEAARAAGEDELALEEEKQEALEAVRRRYQEASIQAALSTAMREAQAFARIFIPSLMSGWNNAATVNRRYTAEFARYSAERREAELLEAGVVQSTADAHALAAEEAQAAAQAQAAAEKERIAESLAALAIEWGLRAIAAAASQNYAAAAAYGAAAVGAAIAASRLHADAVQLQQSRGYTAEERDSLTDMSGASGGGSSSGGTEGGTRSVGGGDPVREVHYIYIGDPFLTPAENARMVARRIELVQRLDLLRRVG